jgi:hypothetical protein
MVKVADALGDAGPMLPKHITSKGAALAVIMAGDELGIPPMAALRGLFLVNGKVGMDYSLMVGLLRRAGYKVQWVAKGPERCELLITHPDGTTHTEVWDVERAKKAKLWGNSGPWSTYPEAMLSARCVSSAARAFAGDVLAGCYSMDEVREISGGTVNMGGSEVHVGEIIDPKDTYEDPKQADEKSRVKAIAEGFCAEVLPNLEERIAQAVQEMQECAEVATQDEAAGEMERKAVTANHRSAIKAWVAELGPRYIAACDHPACSSAKSKVWLRLRKWAEAARIDADDVKAMLRGGVS